jgi:DNA-binding MarR family transcriptional regulator
MTEFSRLSKFVHEQSGNNIARDELTDVTPHVSHTDADIPVVLQDLLADADELVKNGEGLDDAWMSTAAAYLARVISDGDSEGVIGTQNAFRQLATRIHQTASPGGSTSETVSTDSQRDWNEARIARQVLDQVNVLIHVADAGAGIVRPRGLGVKLEPESMVARILLALTQDTTLPNEDLRATIDTTKSQLSRACTGLASQGLITRRTQGRRAAWTLTGAGAEAARALRALQAGRPSMSDDHTHTRTTVTANNRSELRRAIDAWSDVIAVHLSAEVGTGSTDDRSAARPEDPESPASGICRYFRTTAVDADEFGDGEGLLVPAPVVIRTEDPQTTYVRQDWWAHSGSTELEEQTS